MSEEDSSRSAAEQPAPAASAPLDESAPAVMVLRTLQKLIIEARKDPQHRQVADQGMRILVDVQRALAANKADPGAIQWLRQLALTWNTKIRNQGLKFRRVFELLDQAGPKTPPR